MNLNANRVILITAGSGLTPEQLEGLCSRVILHEEVYESQDPVCFGRGELSKCVTDHGERTNYKLRDQPFYHRNKTGKMRSW